MSPSVYIGMFGSRLSRTLQSAARIAVLFSLVFVATIGIVGVVTDFRSDSRGGRVEPIRAHPGPLNWDGRQVLVILLGSADCGLSTAPLKLLSVFVS